MSARAGGGTRSAALPAREALASRTLRVLKRGRGLKPDVLLVEGTAGPIVVKDYAARRGGLARLLAPRLVARELRVHAALDGIEAVPRALGRIDARALALEYRPGEPLSRSLAARLPEGFHEALAAAVDVVHARGVVHLDLRHRDNVLLARDGRPVLLDFGGALCFRPGSWLYRFYRPTLLHWDRRALAKWRERLRADARPSPRGPLRALRRLRRRLRAPRA